MATLQADLLALADEWHERARSWGGPDGPGALHHCEKALRALVKAHPEGANDLNAVYHERDQVVAGLSKCFPSHLCQDMAEEEGWRWIVCVHSPAGQLTWHIADKELPLFAHLERQDNHWDGHTTEEKYRRLSALPAAPVELCENEPCTRPSVLMVGHNGEYHLCRECADLPEFSKYRVRKELRRPAPAAPVDDDNYVAWLRIVPGKRDYESAIKVCDSDDEGAFKVWRRPAPAAPAPDAPAGFRVVPGDRIKLLIADLRDSDTVDDAVRMAEEVLADAFPLASPSWISVKDRLPGLPSWRQKFHHLWTKAVGTPDYDKQEWKDLEAALSPEPPAGEKT